MDSSRSKCSLRFAALDCGALVPADTGFLADLEAKLRFLAFWIVLQVFMRLLLERLPTVQRRSCLAGSPGTLVWSSCLRLSRLRLRRVRVCCQSMILLVTKLLWVISWRWILLLCRVLAVLGCLRFWLSVVQCGFYGF